MWQYSRGALSALTRDRDSVLLSHIRNTVYGSKWKRRNTATMVWINLLDFTPQGKRNFHRTGLSEKQWFIVPLFISCPSRFQQSYQRSCVREAHMNTCLAVKNLLHSTGEAASSFWVPERMTRHLMRRVWKWFGTYVSILVMKRGLEANGMLKSSYSLLQPPFLNFSNDMTYLK